MDFWITTKINGGGWLEDIPIVDGGPSIIINSDYDEIIICSLPGMQVIKDQLISMGVNANKINVEYILVQVNARINFLHDYSQVYKDEAQQHNVAEGGVFQGDFSKEINQAFPKSVLYLFDTFEGFVKRDTNKEKEQVYSDFNQGHLSNTSVEMVLSKLPYPDKVCIRKGYFPETTKGLENERFFFVNLDFDLYNPTFAGLNFFYDRMSPHGIILVHDYYNPGYRGIKEAIEDFEQERGISLHKIPIGDHCSMGIIR